MDRETHYVKNHKGLSLETWLFRPSVSTSNPKPCPAIVLCSGVGAEKADGLPGMAELFRSAGYAAVLFDYATFGGSEGTPRHTVIVDDQYRDFASVVDWTKQQPGIDGSRVVAWGTSFGGMHVTRLLAERRDVAAGIAQCPCVDAYAASRMKPLAASLRLSFWALLDTVGSYLGFAPIYVAMSARDTSNGPALMIGEETFEGWSTLHPPPRSADEDDGLYNKIVARSTLSFPRSRPGLLASQIRAPYLLVVPLVEKVAPRDAAIQAAREAPKGELVEVPGGHFDVYKGNIGYEQTIAAELEFLKRVVPV